MKYYTNFNYKRSFWRSIINLYRGINIETSTYIVCVGQNKLVMSLLEDFGLKFDLEMKVEVKYRVMIINHEKNEVYKHYIF
jgi:hypothetical protein